MKILFDKSANQWYLEINDNLVRLSSFQANKIIQAGNLKPVTKNIDSSLFTWN